MNKENWEKVWGRGPGPRRFRRGRHWVAAVSVLGLAACATQSSTESNDDEAVSQVESAIVTTSSVSFTLPSGVDWRKVAVAASNGVTLGDRVRLSGLTTTSATTAVTAVQNDAKVASIFSDGKVTLGDRSVVTGDIKANGTITRSPTSSVTGSVVSGAGLTTQKISWSYQKETTSLGAQTVNAGQSKLIPPGTYGNLTVNSQASATLTSGVYVFTNMTIQAQSKLLIDSSHGPVQIYLTGTLSFQGVVASALTSIPQLLVFASGTGPVTIQPSFTGVLIAPNADVRLAAALPNGHRGQFYGKTVTLEPDTVITPYPFDWGSVIPSLTPTIDSATPVHAMPNSPADLPISVDKNGAGPTTKTGDSATPINFTLPTSYPVEGGIIANGTVTFKYKNGGGTLVTCTYKGGSSSASPATKADINAGRYLNFQSCSDGLPVTTPRTGNHFEVSVTPAPGLPVTVNTPVRADGACSDKMEIMSAQTTTQLHDGFNWSSATKLPATNSDGSPTLYYAWVYIRSKDDAIKLRQLYIHVLGRPLFQQELEQYGAACGTFTNPGDGSGQFVPVVMPGALYNKMIDALTASGLSGQRQIFEAVIIRKPSATLSPTTFPSGAANANGSLSYGALANANFKYLGYDADPWSDKSSLTMYASTVTAALVDVVKWVGQAAKDVGHGIETTLASFSKFWSGSVNVGLSLNAITHDASFGSGDPIMVRAWGPFAGTPLGAPNLRVSLLQKFQGTFIPTVSDGYTNMTGFTSIDAVKGQSPRGSGLCINLSNDAAFVTDFLWSSDVCDLRGFDANVSSSIGDFQLKNFDKDATYAARIFNTRLSGLYEADDTYRWDQTELRWTPHQATILSGYWADTFSEHNDGVARLGTVCLTYGTLTQKVIDASAGAGLLASLLVPGAPIVAFALNVFEEIMGRSDIIMSTHSTIPNSRSVMTHEYGHYTFCGLLASKNPHGVDHIIWSTIAGKQDLTKGYSYVNEAFADFITGQVASAANYDWLQHGKVGAYPGGQYCAFPTVDRCFDYNYNGTTTDPKNSDNVGRIASMLHDAFDGPATSPTQSTPNNADAWIPLSGGGLGIAPTSVGSMDETFENVQIPAQGVIDFAQAVADGLMDFGVGPQIDDPRIYGALNTAMVKNGVSRWCDRCRVLGLHSTMRERDDDVGASFTACINDPMVKNALNGSPPEPNGRIDAATCTACPPGQFSDAAGACKVCVGTLVGNTCMTCPIDLKLDGATMPLTAPTTDPTVATPGDTCAGVFWVELDNPQALYTRGMTRLDLLSGPIDFEGATKADCEHPFELDLGHLASTGPAVDTILTGTGVYTDPGGGGLSLHSCGGYPTKSFLASDVTAGQPLLFAVPATTFTRLIIDARPPGGTKVP